MTAILFPPDPWWSLRLRTGTDLHNEFLAIDGLMGIYWPGHGELCVDYDQFNDGDAEEPCELSVCVFPEHVLDESKPRWMPSSWPDGAWMMRGGRWRCMACEKPVCELIWPQYLDAQERQDRARDQFQVSRLVAEIMGVTLLGADKERTIDESMQPMTWKGKRLSCTQTLHEES